MAGQWDKTYIDGDRIYHYEMNDIISAIKHTGPLVDVELMHTFNRNNGNQAFKIDADNDGTFLYGQNALSYTRFNNDGTSTLYANDKLELKSNTDEIRLKSSGDVVFEKLTADQSFRFHGFESNSWIYGGTSTMRCLILRANETDVAPKIKMEGLSNLEMYTNDYFTVINNGASEEQTFKTYRAPASDHVTWWGSNEADIGLLIRTNELSGAPYIHMHNGAYGGADNRMLNIFTKEDFIIKSGEHTGQMFKAKYQYQADGSQDYITWYAGNTNDTKLFIKPTEGTDSYMTMDEDGGIEIFNSEITPGVLKSFMPVDVYNHDDGYKLYYPGRFENILTGSIYADSDEGWLCINGPVDDMVSGTFQWGIRIDGTPAVGWEGKNYIEIGKDLMMLKSEGIITLSPTGSVAIDGNLNMNGNNITNISLLSSFGKGSIIVDNDLDMDGNAITGSGAGHDQFSDFVADEHIGHSGVSITAGNHLTGGGDITATRTLDVSDDWYDSVADIPTATPSGGDITHLSTADNIYDFVSGGYSPIGHTHVEANITDLDKYTQAEADALLLGKSDTTHNHDTVYLKLSGGSMIGGIDMGSNSISNLNEITTATDTDLHLNPNGIGEVKFGIETLNAGSDRGKLVKLKTDAGDVVYVKTYDLV